MSQQLATILRFEVTNEDVVVDLSLQNTVFQLMSIVCSEWLDEARGGDGDVHDHLWKISTLSSKHISSDPNYDNFQYDDGDDVRGYYENEYSSTKLQNLAWQPGTVLKVEYDFGTTTYFDIALKSIESKPTAYAQTCPCRSGSNNDNPPLTPCTLPPGTPNLNDIFPAANELLFHSNAQWILLFENFTKCALAVEAGSNAMVVYAPLKFASFTETLVALNMAGQKKPPNGIREDAFCRLIFPLKMKASEEKKYRAFKAEKDEFDRVCNNGLMSLEEASANEISQRHMHRLCGPSECILRVTESDMESCSSMVDLDKAFPKMAAAQKAKYKWISYRRNKIMICKGKPKSDRGIPCSDQILAKAENQHIDSLNELVCIAESMWASI